METIKNLLDERDFCDLTTAAWHQDLKCFFGLHKYEVYDEETMQDARGGDIGKVIICRCANCGKIRKYEIITTKMF